MIEERKQKFFPEIKVLQGSIKYRNKRQFRQEG